MRTNRLRLVKGPEGAWIEQLWKLPNNKEEWRTLEIVQAHEVYPDKYEDPKKKARFKW